MDQVSPAACARRVGAASPGGSRTQLWGAVSTLPSAARTVFGVGPGVKVWLVSLLSCGVVSWSPRLRLLAAEQWLLGELRRHYRSQLVGRAVLFPLRLV